MMKPILQCALSNDELGDVVEYVRTRIYDQTPCVRVPTQNRKREKLCIKKDPTANLLLYCLALTKNVIFFS